MNANLEVDGLSRRRFLTATGGLAALSFGVGACGSDSDGPSSEESTGLPSGELTGEIRWGIRDYFADQAKELIVAYQAVQPGVKVRLELLPTAEAEYVQRISTARLGGNLPDVIATTTTFVDVFAASGVTADLARLFQEGGFPKDYFVESLYEGFRVGEGRRRGEVHGLPQSADAIITAYNTQHFEEAGLDAPSDDWAWEDFLETAQRLQKKSGDETVRWGAYVDHNAPPLYDPITQSFGGKVIEDDGSSFLLDSDAMLQAWHLLIDPRKEGVFSSLQASQAAGFGDLFNSGTASMQFTVRAAVPAMRSTVETFDVATFPSVNGQNKTGAGAVGLAMTADANEEVSLDFLKWFFSEDGGMTILGASYGTVPPIPSLRNSETWRDLPPPPANNDAFVQAFENGVLPAEIPSNAAGRLAEAISQAGEQVLLNGRSIEEAFAEANDFANEAL